MKNLTDFLKLPKRKLTPQARALKRRSSEMFKSIKGSKRLKVLKAASPMRFWDLILLCLRMMTNKYSKV